MLLLALATSAYAECDEWCGSGNGKNAVAIYSSRGEVLKNYALSDLYSRQDLLRFALTGEGTEWRCNAPTLGASNELAVPDAIGGRLVFTLATGAFRVERGAGTCASAAGTVHVSAAGYTLVTKCKASLSVISADPNEKNLTLEATSQPFAPTVSGFGQSHVALAIGDYAVRAEMQMSAPFADPGMQPRLVASLVKGGNPVTGQINYSSVGGIDLDSRPMGVPLSVTSMAFVSAQYQGRNVSRIDFSCSVTKFQ
jgi:hypothetical protein